MGLFIPSCEYELNFCGEFGLDLLQPDENVRINKDG